MELKNSIIRLENSGKAWKVERIKQKLECQNLKEKINDLDEMSKEYEKCKSTGKEHAGNVGYQQWTKYSNYRHKKGRKIPGEWYRSDLLSSQLPNNSLMCKQPLDTAS